MRSLSRSTMAALTAAALFTTACSPDAATAPAPAVAPSLQRTAQAPFQLDLSTLELRAGDSHQLSVTKSANDRDVPESSVRWSSADEAVATVSGTGLVSAVAVGQTTVTVSRGAHRLDVLVTVVDPCTPRPMALGLTTGEITADDCYFPLADRYSDYYRFAPAQGEVVRVESSGIDGIVGIKQATADPFAGTIFGSRNVGVPFRIIGNGDPVQLYMSGRDATTFGDYAITRSVDTDAHDCSTLTFVMPGTSFGSTLTAANSCRYTVEFSPVPEAIGQPLDAHRYWVRLDEVKPYTVTLGGVSADFDPALTIFPNLVNGAPVAQATPDAGPPSSSTRSVEFTPPAPGYYLIEIASGRFVGSLETWVVQSGAFTLSVSR